jgi:hypothetical protein
MNEVALARLHANVRLGPIVAGERKAARAREVRRGIVNSDPELLVSFIAFLRRYFGVTNDQMRVRCNLFADDAETQRRIEDYWLERLGLDRTKLWKSAVNVYSKYSQKKRRGKLPYGTCTLRVHSSKVVQTIYGSIQEYGGFDRPAWLG